jgi:hypothetical protein
MDLYLRFWLAHHLGMSPWDLPAHLTTPEAIAIVRESIR